MTGPKCLCDGRRGSYEDLLLLDKGDALAKIISKPDGGMYAGCASANDHDILDEGLRDASRSHDRRDSQQAENPSR